MRGSVKQLNSLFTLLQFSRQAKEDIITWQKTTSENPKNRVNERKRLIARKQST